ncbi:amino acid ABC transporter substrate-binding protein [uncultured Ilumatobacter sp.]|uniref:amino acid ABC transporter substrate-binding protein n=1 Tax=Ilumatobacter sp. TaxID=1967498 RepID=UPI0030A3B444
MIRRGNALKRTAGVVMALGLVVTACSSSSDGDADSDTGDSVATEDTAAATDGGETDDVEVTQSSGGRLAAVKAAGVLECGGNDTLPGFGIIDADGSFSGFDIDFCKVIAAAVLGDSEAVNVTPLVAAQRFPTLQSGEIDVLIRNTTWTASRDGAEQANFLQTTFFDGQGFMVRADSGIASIADASNTTICVLTGTTTLLNMNAVLGDRGIPFTALEFESNDELQPAFVAEQCEVWTSDASQLAAFAATLDVDTAILPDIISKEPLGPVVADGDTEWAQAVNWAVMATIQAEEFGITSANIGSFADSEDSGIRRFLGLPIDDGDGNEVIAEVGLGLPTDFASNIISQVGNYGEIFERNLAPLSLSRGPNALWTDGGLMYVPPFR